MERTKRVLFCPLVFPTLKVPNGVKAALFFPVFMLSCFSVTKRLHIDWPSWKVELCHIVKSSLIITRYGLPAPWVQVAISSCSCGCFR